MYKMIVTDLDGTLLRKDKSISDYNYECLDKAMKQGTKFAVATGRMIGTAKLAIKNLPYEGFIITSNGAMVTDLQTGEIIQSIPMEKETAFRAIDVCRKRDLYFHIYTETAMYSEKYDFIVKRFTEELKDDPENETIIGVVNDAKLIFDKEVVHKLGIMSHDRKALDEAIAEIKEGGPINTFMSLSTSCDIMGMGVTKATGIEALCRHYGITKEEVIALGDNENDIGMIEYAGLGVAMDNALDHIKAHADYIADTNEADGFGKVIDEFILQRGE